MSDHASIMIKEDHIAKCGCRLFGSDDVAKQFSSNHDPHID